jgi:nucleoside-diphosphate-sugar epimerase
MRRILSAILSPLILAVVTESLQVAVIGTTGNIGSAVIKQLSKQNIRTRCLLRHDISNVPVKDSPSTSKERAAYLASLDNVEMVQGDVSDPSSIIELVKGCDVIMALQGAPRTNPLLSLFPILSDKTATYHPYTTNYIGVKNIIEAAEATPCVKRIVRITGKGEDPFQFFSILLNMLGHLGKGWNYEGEQLLRQSGLDYTIVRPGILKGSDDYTEPPKARGLVDDGMDMKVTFVTYDQIADLCVKSLKYDNTKKSTLSVMNVEENTGEDSYDGLLAKVQADRREFAPSLIDKHRMGARLGFSVLCILFVGFSKGVLGLISLFA